MDLSEVPGRQNTCCHKAAVNRADPTSSVNDTLFRVTCYDREVRDNCTFQDAGTNFSEVKFTIHGSAGLPWTQGYIQEMRLNADMRVFSLGDYWRSSGHVGEVRWGWISLSNKVYIDIFSGA
jgi:hypothetical protein